MFRVVLLIRAGYSEAQMKATFSSKHYERGKIIDTLVMKDGQNLMVCG